MVPKFYSYTDSGAPSVSCGDTNSIAKILTACLISGYGSKTAAGWTAPYSGTAGTTEGVIFSDTWSGNANTGLFGGICLATGSTIATPGTGDYTFELWAYFRSWKSNNNIAYLHASSGSVWGFTGNTSQILAHHNSSSITMGTTATLSLNTWYHLALTRQSGVVRAFVNGTQQGATITASNNITAANFVIGANVPGTGSVGYQFDGYLQDIRYTTGTAIYTTTFTAPTAALTNLTGTSLLINGTGTWKSSAFTDSSTAAYALTAISLYKTNIVQGPYGSYNPTTTDDTVYVNSLGRGLCINSGYRFLSKVRAYSTITSLTGGTLPFFPKDFFNTSANIPYWYTEQTGAPAADATKTLKWTVAATDKFFYLNIDAGTSTVVDNVNKLFHKDGQIAYASDEWYGLTYCFGTLSDLQTSGIDSICSYDFNDGIAAVFNNCTSFLYKPFKCYSGIKTNSSGIVVNSLNNNTNAITSLNGSMFSPFRELIYFQVNATNYNNTTLLADAKVSPIIDHDFNGVTYFIKVPLFSAPGISVSNFADAMHIGHLPGLHILGFGGESVKHFTSISTNTVDTNTPKTFRAIKNIVESWTHTVYLDEGDWG